MELKENSFQLLSRPSPQSGVITAWRFVGQKTWYEVEVGASLIAPDGSYVEFQLNQWQFYCQKCGEALKHKTYFCYFAPQSTLAQRYCARARCCPLAVELSGQNPSLRTNLPEKVA